jgi:hypothetical protein
MRQQEAMSWSSLTRTAEEMSQRPSRVVTDRSIYPRVSWPRRDRVGDRELLAEPCQVEGGDSYVDSLSGLR